MTRVELAPGVLEDFDQFFDHHAQFDVKDSPERIAEVIAALDILQHSPLIGRPARGGKRELVIGKGSRGYVALYRYVPNVDTVFVLVIRSQRERGFKSGR